MGTFVMDKGGRGAGTLPGGKEDEPYGKPRCAKMFGKDNGRDGGHTDQVISCSVSSGTLYTGSLDRTIKAWDIQTEKVTTTFQGHLRGIRCVHAEGDRLFSGAGDSMAKQ